MKPFIIYALRDPVTKEIRYIGKCTSLPSRLKAHLNSKDDTRKCRWIASLRTEGYRPEALKLEEGVGDWQSRERFWIAFYRSEGNDLCNHTDGGEGLSGASEETRNKLRELQQALWKDECWRSRMLLALKSPLRCRRISVALAGKKKEALHVSKLPQNSRGYKHTKDFAARISTALRGNKYRVGKKMSSESKARISNSLLGHSRNKGCKQSAESNRKRSLALKGRPKSEEWKKKARIAALRRWEREREQNNVKVR